jgi:hypothetical protein
LAITIWFYHKILGYIALRNSGAQAVLAPFKLKFRGSAEEKNLINQYDGKDVILLNIWQTRCDKPRTDLVLYLDWLTDDHRFVYVKGTAVNQFLKNRSCDPLDEYDVDKVFT